MTAADHPVYAFAPAPQTSLALAGDDRRVPVRRVYCVGRNYADHALEMGGDPEREPPFFFQKNPDNLIQSDRMAYPSQTADLHHEIELAVVLHSGGRDITPEAAMSHVFGYGVALDMTRRDLQAQAKKAGRPWEAGKAAEASAPIGLIQPVATLTQDIRHAAITLQVNGAMRQSSRIDAMIWSIPEIIAQLSQLFTLAAGDVILTGTPAGVAACTIGDRLHAEIDGLPALDVMITAD